MLPRNCSLSFHPVLLIFTVAGALIGCGQKERVHGSPKTGPLGREVSNSGSKGGAINSAAADIRFHDVTVSSGVTYSWSIRGNRPLNILQTIGNGCAFLDYNNDGNLDILLVGDHLALYRGDGHGHFTDVSAATGLAGLRGHFLGCAVGDYDADGYDDIYLSGYRTGLLLHNEGGKRFTDATTSAGLKAQPWGTSAGFAETEPGSGRLDLFVGNYVHFGPDVKPQLCPNHQYQTACGPRYYVPIKGVFYRNVGRGRFADATATAGFGAVHGRDLGIAWGSTNDSGLPALAVENDETAGDLFQPQQHSGGATFTDIGDTSGTAYDRDGAIHGGMGVDWGDYDNDGRLDLFVGTFQNEEKCLYHNDGNGLFTDMGTPAGLNGAVRGNVTFGCKFLDADNDGWLDLALANGHIQDNVHLFDTTTTYRQATLLFHNEGGGSRHFVDISKEAGEAFSRPVVGRGLAVGDFDNDGREDLLVVDSEGKPMLLHNDTAGGHWLGVKLEGVKSNRDGYGAILVAHAGERTLTRQCQSGGSYLSASDPRVHFGLGKALAVSFLTVRWPDGRQDSYRNIPADRYITLREGAPAPLPYPAR